MRRLLLIAGLTALLGVAGCADENSDDDGTDTEAAPAVTTAEPPQTTTDVQEGAGEVSDLPECDEAGTVRPCRTPDGAVLEEGGENAGEISDLPLCGESPPPCRNPDGSFEEP